MFSTLKYNVLFYDRRGPLIQCLGFERRLEGPRIFAMNFLSRHEAFRSKSTLPYKIERDCDCL